MPPALNAEAKAQLAEKVVLIGLLGALKDIDALAEEVCGVTLIYTCGSADMLMLMSPHGSVATPNCPNNARHIPPSPLRFISTHRRASPPPKSANNSQKTATTSAASCSVLRRTSAPAARSERECERTNKREYGGIVVLADIRWRMPCRYRVGDWEVYSRSGSW
jgi:hypothetical protein